MYIFRYIKYKKIYFNTWIFWRNMQLFCFNTRLFCGSPSPLHGSPQSNDRSLTYSYGNAHGIAGIKPQVRVSSASVICTNKTRREKGRRWPVEIYFLILNISKNIHLYFILYITVMKIYFNTWIEYQI